ncbi:hydrolase 2, exosortase A system-associated [uncultured Lamprocystis sp.]|uniref:hydrolase 2, exosortase A system-associated n=1 Tax=uncultured Lamprocystis sp. TaxID=543132 RepID=UPI0025E1FE86|nr:hydrolase 2, exosortase A system-associated [uncultured Lamprocystis sp.]
MLRARFLEGPRGRLFCVGMQPPEQPGPQHWMLVVPPLLEELNQSRRTLHLLGRALAARGIGCLLPDLYGTGDSEGAIGDASWDTWIADLNGVHAWLLRQGAMRVDLLALRGGALLTRDWLAAMPIRVPHLILWQPSISGAHLVQQLLRLRLAAGLLHGSRTTAAALRERMALDGWIEIAGYRLSATLIAACEGTSLEPPDAARVGTVDWFQLVATDQAIPPAVHRCADSWSAAGLQIGLHPIVGDTFWATPEIVESNRLIASTVSRLEQVRDALG